MFAKLFGGESAGDQSPERSHTPTYTRSEYTPLEGSVDQGLLTVVRSLGEDMIQSVSPRPTEKRTQKINGVVFTDVIRTKEGAVYYMCHKHIVAMQHADGHFEMLDKRPAAYAAPATTSSGSEDGSLIDGCPRHRYS